jgi:hypothetical protein
MTDTVSVSHDLAEAGAATLSKEEAEGLMRLPRARPTALIAAAVLAVVTTGVSLGMRAGSSQPKPAEPMVMVPLPKAPEPVKVEAPPVVTVEQEDDELAPLPVKPKPVLIRPVRKAPAAPRPASEPHEPSVSGDDFALPQDDAAEGLKRPSL